MENGVERSWVIENVFGSNKFCCGWKQKCLGLHHTGTENNIEVHEIPVEGFMLEHNRNHTFDIFIDNMFHYFKHEHSEPYYLWVSKWNIVYLDQWLKSEPLVDFYFQGLLCLKRTLGGGIEMYILHLFWLFDHCRRTCCVIEKELKKKYDRGFAFAKLEKSNRERKCCADVLNEGEYDFYIYGLGLRVYDLGLWLKLGF